MGTGWLDKLVKLATHTGLITEDQAKKSLGNFPMFTYQYLLAGSAFYEKAVAG